MIPLALIVIVGCVPADPYVAAATPEAGIADAGIPLICADVKPTPTCAADKPVI